MAFISSSWKRGARNSARDSIPPPRALASHSCGPFCGSGVYGFGVVLGSMSERRGGDQEPRLCLEDVLIVHTQHVGMDPCAMQVPAVRHHSSLRRTAVPQVERLPPCVLLGVPVIGHSATIRIPFVPSFLAPWRLIRGAVSNCGPFWDHFGTILGAFGSILGRPGQEFQLANCTTLSSDSWAPKSLSWRSKTRTIERSSGTPLQ